MQRQGLSYLSVAARLPRSPHLRGTAQNSTDSSSSSSSSSSASFAEAPACDSSAASTSTAAAVAPPSSSEIGSSTHAEAGKAETRSSSSWSAPQAQNGSPPLTDDSIFSASAAAAGLDSIPPDSENETAYNKKHNGLWTVFKVVFAGALIAGTTGSAYATYAFTTEEVEKKVAAMQLSAKESSIEHDGLLQRVQDVFHSTSLKAAASVAGLYLEIRKAIEDQIMGFAAPTSDKLLPDLAPQEQHVFTLVLDLNETLVYSDWKRDRGWRTFKRPGVDAFLEHLAQYYELVIYTDQLPFYVDPILERLDQKGCIRYRLSREATYYVNGKHFRDLSKLNRNPARVIYLSAHATETCLQPENTVIVKPWKLETEDTTLLDLLPFFEYVARYRPADIRPVLASYSGHDIPAEFRVRTKEYQRKMRELKFQNPFFKGSRSSQ